MKRCAGLALTFCLAATGVMAQAEDINVLVSPSYAPMEYRDPTTGTLTGLDIDLQEALARAMGVEVVWQETSFPQLISSLQTGRGQVIHSGMSDLPSRRETLVFLDYMKSGAQFFTLAERGAELSSPEDFCGLTVGTPKSTSFPDEVAAFSAEHCEAKGRPPVEVLAVESGPDTLLQLRQGRVDGGVFGSETLPYLAAQGDVAIVTVGEPIAAVMQGLAFLKDDTALLGRYQAALAEIMDSGEYAAIFTKWDQSVNMIDGIHVNGEAVR